MVDYRVTNYNHQGENPAIPQSQSGALIHNPLEQKQVFDGLSCQELEKRPYGI
jgi:hypothetical protein